MARTNMTATRVRPADARLITLEVLHRERISPNFARVTLGGRDIDRFSYMGFDQWFRLFLPVSESSLARLPSKLDTVAYLRYLTIAKTDRPVLRNYSVRAFRSDGAAGPELDIDFVLHGSAAEGTAGPAATWAETCAAGSAVALLDEGIAYNPPAHLSRHVTLVADETGIPAAAGILASMPRDAVGHAFLEVPHAGDRQALEAPDGMEVRWVARDGRSVPGLAVMQQATAVVPSDPFYGWVAGEQSLATGMRRHWVHAGVPKDAISFSGYWKAAAHR